MDVAAPHRLPNWKWFVCGLLLLATMLNYMDRQTLAQTSTEISREYRLSNEQYGNLEFGFGWAFAGGSIVWGLLADRLSVRRLYPVVLIGWSAAGLATAFAAPLGIALQDSLTGIFGPDLSWLGLEPKTHPAYLGLLLCRTALGFFEAGQWPCALVVSQRILSARERTLGNSILQSGASLGAIVTPLIVQIMVTPQPGGWRGPFLVIGLAGLTWTLPWLLLVRRGDLARGVAKIAPAAAAKQPADPRLPLREYLGPFLALIVTVVAINLNWQFLRAWLPKFLRESHGYEAGEVNFFSTGYYIAADIGCLAAGFASRRLVAGGWGVHRSRMATFTICALLAAFSTVAAHLARGPLLLGLLLAMGFGSLGVFPAYYSLTQELSLKHQGKITGVLSAATWICTAVMQKMVGREIDETHSYARAIFWLGLAPAIACAALWLLWTLRESKTLARSASEEDGG